MLHIISHPDCSLHEMGRGHIECPERIIAIENAIKTANFNDIKLIKANSATKEQILKAHDEGYITNIFSLLLSIF